MNSHESSLDDLLWFVRVAQAGSLSSAATQLGIPKSTLSKRLARMESSLGVSLVHRNSRSFRLTEAGSRLMAGAGPLLQQLETMTDDLRSDQSPARGLVRFSASGSFGKLVLIPLVSAYLLEHPQVRIEAELTDRRVNLIEEGFDFAVRIGELPDSGLHVRRVGTVRRILCAAPAYRAKHGLPEEPGQLPAHSCLIQSKTSASITMQNGSRSVTVFLPARLVAGPSDNLLVPVQMGVGISALPEIQVAALLRKGELLRVLPDWDLAAFDVQVLYPEQRSLPPATRSVIDHLVTAIPAQIERLLRGS